MFFPLLVLTNLVATWLLTCHWGWFDLYIMQQFTQHLQQAIVTVQRWKVLKRLHFNPCPWKAADWSDLNNSFWFLWVIPSLFVVLADKNCAYSCFNHNNWDRLPSTPNTHPCLEVFQREHYDLHDPKLYKHKEGSWRCYHLVLNNIQQFLSKH